MGIFNKKKSEDKQVREEEKPKNAVKSTVGVSVLQKQVKNDILNVLIRPRITEKATESAERNQYVFEINPRCNKKQISNAVKEMYGVDPIKVNVTKIQSKKVFLKGKKGVKSGGKKAIVYLKKGDKIDIV